MITTAIETLRSVAHRAAEDPQPPTSGAATRLPAMTGLLARLATLVTGLLGAAVPAGGTLRIIAQVITTFLPLLDVNRPPAANTAMAPNPPVKTSARLDLLRQERDARSRQRRIGETLIAQHRVRPDRPPAALGFATVATQAPTTDAWNDLLDLTSEALETFVVLGDAAGAARCVELLGLLADTFAVDLPAAA